MSQIRYKLLCLSLLGLLGGLLLLVTPGARAGGWAMVTLDTLPIEPHAGQPLHLGFMVRQHGLTPINDLPGAGPLQPYLLARNMDTAETIQVEAHQEGPPGHFVVEVTFPSPGDWAWEIRPEPFGAIPTQFEPLTVLPSLPAPTGAESVVPEQVPSLGWLMIFTLMIAAGLGLAVQRQMLTRKTGLTIGLVALLTMAASLVFWPAASLGLAGSSEAAQPISALKATDGRALFIAKGCPACHIHPGISHSIPGPLLGPRLTDNQLNPDLLRRWLRNPSSVRSNARMPNLNLSEAEIDVLIAFLLNPEADKKKEARSQPEPTQAISISERETASGEHPTGASALKAKVQPVELFLARPQGAKGPLVAYNMSNNDEYFRLPPGLLSADQDHYLAAIARQNSDR